MGVATDLPCQYPSAFRSQQQHAILRRQRNAMDPLWEGHEGFLVAFFPAIHMDDGLLGLRSENMCGAHSNAIGRRGAFLEDMPLGGQRLEFVDEDAGVFEDSRVWLGRSRYGGDKVFGEHGRGVRMIAVGGRRSESSEL